MAARTQYPHLAAFGGIAKIHHQIKIDGVK
jgi:hypothetical protein